MNDSDKLSEKVKELLLFCEKDGEVKNGFRSKVVIQELRELSTATDEKESATVSPDELKEVLKGIITYFDSAKYWREHYNPSTSNEKFGFNEMKKKLEEGRKLIEKIDGKPIHRW
jgi:hypothetical protein